MFSHVLLKHLKRSVLLSTIISVIIAPFPLQTLLQKNKLQLNLHRNKHSSGFKIFTMWCSGDSVNLHFTRIRIDQQSESLVGIVLTVHLGLNTPQSRTSGFNLCDVSVSGNRRQHCDLQLSYHMFLCPYNRTFYSALNGSGAFVHWRTTLFSSTTSCCDVFHS